MDSGQKVIKIAYLTDVKIPNAEAVSEQVLNNLEALSGQSPNYKFTLIVPSFTNDGNDVLAIKQYYGITSEVTIRFMAFYSWSSVKFRKKIFAFFAPLICAIQGYDIVYTRHQNILFFSLFFGNYSVFDTYRIDINHRTKFFFWRKFCYHQSRLLGIITHSQISKNSFLKEGVAPDRMLLAYNGCKNIPEDKPKRSELRKKFNISDSQKVVCYAGRIGEKSKRTDLVLQLAHHFPDMTFLIIGGGKNQTDDAAFDEMIIAMKLMNVVRTGRLEPASMPQYLQMSDFLVIPPSSDPLQTSGKTVLPLKIFLYLAVGKPIIAPNLPDVREILHHGHNAILVNPDEIGDMAEQLLQLKNDPVLQVKLSRWAKEDSTIYTWDCRAQKIIHFIRAKYN